jgi:hypothetical protein
MGSIEIEKRELVLEEEGGKTKDKVDGKEEQIVSIFMEGALFHMTLTNQHHIVVSCSVL